MPTRNLQNVKSGIEPRYLDRFIELNASETPAFSMIRKGSPLMNPVAFQPADTRRTASKRGVADNTDVDNYRTTNTEVLIESLNHWFREPFGVGTKTERLVDQAGVGRKKQFVRERERADLAIKLAADQVICDNDDMREEDGVNGSETRGLFKFCQTTAQSIRPVPEIARTPADQISTAKFDEFGETTLQGLINAHFDNTGHMGRFIGLCGTEWHQMVSNWSIFDDTKTAEISYIRRFNSSKAEAKTLSAIVSVLECVGGRMELHVSRNLYYSRDKDTATADISQYSMIGWHDGSVELRYGWEPEYIRLEDKGGGPRGAVSMDFAVCANPKAMVKHVPSALT